MTFFQKHPSSTLSFMENFPKEECVNVSKLFEEVLPFCAPTDREKLNQMKNMYQNFANMQEMIQMLQMMKDLFPEAENPMGGDPSAIFSGLSGFADMFGSQGNSTGMDMSQLFEMFGNMNQ